MSEAHGGAFNPMVRTEDDVPDPPDDPRDERDDDDQADDGHSTEGE